jgi:hypothetical protein
VLLYLRKRRIHEFEAKYRAEQATSQHDSAKSSESTKGGGNSGNKSSTFASSITEMAGKASWYFPSGANIKEMSKSTSNKAASKLFQLFHHKSNGQK